ncbi:hypothetical protein [Actinospongicola halichondriae]|uniref:hypothetical protein n=1 Tax=Actinospongicola halichondriae TaxID=3236844 RepID=UPI003D51AB3F
MLRTLMLTASERLHPVEHSVFTSRSAPEWSDLARERATHPRRAIFIAHNAGTTCFNGVLWAFDSHDEHSIEFTWTWADGGNAPDVMAALVAQARQWGVRLGRGHLRLAADNTHEADLFLRLGFVEVGVARDGVRRVLASRP